MSQPSLFDSVDHGKASRNETYTEVVSKHGNQRRAVRDRIVAAGSYGVTLDELADRFGCEPNKISGRVTELKKAGLIVHTKARRKTRAGSTASVIVAMEFVK